MASLKKKIERCVVEKKVNKGPSWITDILFLSFHTDRLAHPSDAFLCTHLFFCGRHLQNIPRTISHRWRLFDRGMRWIWIDLAILDEQPGDIQTENGAKYDV